MHTLHVTIWNEFRQEKSDTSVKAVYPHGIHSALAAHWHQDAGIITDTAILDEPEHGLGHDQLAKTDVLIWWGHRAHHEVHDAVSARVEQQVYEGMGFLALHSAHFSKPFERLMGTSCRLGAWANSGRKEAIAFLDPAHPIAQGVSEGFELPRTEMYSEPFDLPPPDHVLCISSFETGEQFRSGCIWKRDKGHVFYFRPGH